MDINVVPDSLIDGVSKTAFVRPSILRRNPVHEAVHDYIRGFSPGQRDLDPPVIIFSFQCEGRIDDLAPIPRTDEVIEIFNDATLMAKLLYSIALFRRRFISKYDAETLVEVRLDLQSARDQFLIELDALKNCFIRCEANVGACPSTWPDIVDRAQCESTAKSLLIGASISTNSNQEVV
jgi:hypothetical protein